MADDPKPPTPPTPPAPPAKQGDDGKGGADDHMIPKARFDEVNTALKESKDALAKIEAERKAQADEQLKKQGEYQKLHEQEKARADKLEADLKSEKVLAEKFRTTIKVKREAAKKALGDGWLPTFDGIETIEELETLVEKFTKARVGVDGSPPTKPELQNVRGMKTTDFNEMVERAKRGEYTKQ